MCVCVYIRRQPQSQSIFIYLFIPDFSFHKCVKTQSRKKGARKKKQKPYHVYSRGAPRSLAGRPSVPKGIWRLPYTDFSGVKKAEKYFWRRPYTEKLKTCVSNEYFISFVSITKPRRRVALPVGFKSSKIFSYLGVNSFQCP